MNKYIQLINPTFLKTSIPSIESKEINSYQVIILKYFAIIFVAMAISKILIPII